jgi:hypothetical protein
MNIFATRPEPGEDILLAFLLFISPLLVFFFDFLAGDFGINFPGVV